MIKALFLIFEPVGAWNRVVAARRGAFFLMLFYLLPMILIVTVLEGFGLMKWGCQQWRGGQVKIFSAREMLVYEAVHSLMLFAVVFICAQIVKAFCNSSHVRHSFSQGFTVAACGLSPMFLLRMLDVFPAINPWLTWAIGITLCAGTLYHGVPRVMQSDPSQAFGLFITCSVLFVMVSGFERFVTFWFLTGHMAPISQIISSITKHLPF